MSPVGGRSATRLRDLARDHQERMGAIAAESDVLDAVVRMLADLRDIRDVPTLERRLCRDAAEACGFTRVMLSRVDAETWRPWEVSFSVNPEFDRHFATFLRGQPIPFATSPAEATARRTGRPAVHETTDGQVPAPLAGLASSYVVVPLVASTGIFGLLHGDHHPEPQHASSADRTALWLLADGFGDLYARAVLGERVRAQRTRLKQAVQDLEAEVATIFSADAGLARAFPTDPAAVDVDVDVDLSALTPRQRDVAGLLARGYDNAAIARDLIIAEGTVKTHVKVVLRKLGAANRAEAVALLLGHRTRA